MMKYSVLKLVNERKLKTNDGTINPHDAEPVGFSRRYREKKTRRFRSAFTTEQIQYLEKEFQKFPYIESSSRKAVASILKIPERTVKFWFQNRRMKEKKEASNMETICDQDTTNKPAVKYTDTKTFDKQSHTQEQMSYPLTSSLLCPQFTDKAVNNYSSNRNHYCNEIYKSNHEKRRIAVRQFDNMKTFRKNLPKAAYAANMHINEVTEMDMFHKNMCMPKLPPTEMPVKQHLKNMRVIERNPREFKLKVPTTSQVCQPYYYQIHSNDQSYVPFHAPLHQPSPVPGNIIWKPVNMVPVLPKMATPSQVITHNSRYLEQNIPKGQCKCFCKMYNTPQEIPSSMPYIEPSSSSKYILTTPFGNHFDIQSFI